MSSTSTDFLSFVGSLSRFGVKSLVSAVTPPYMNVQRRLRQIPGKAMGRNPDAEAM